MKTSFVLALLLLLFFFSRESVESKSAGYKLKEFADTPFSTSAMKLARFDLLNKQKRAESGTVRVGTTLNLGRLYLCVCNQKIFSHSAFTDSM